MSNGWSRMGVLVLIAAAVSAVGGVGSRPGRADESAESGDGPRAVIEGVVVDQDGRPLAGVAVEACRTDHVVWPHNVASRAAFDYHFLPPTVTGVQATRSDEAGRFRLAGFGRGARCQVRARPDPPLWSVVSGVCVQSLVPCSLRLVVEPGRVCRGRLVDDAGNGVHGWIRAVSSPDRHTWGGCNTMLSRLVETALETDADGRFVFAAPRGDVIRLHARVPGRRYEGHVAILEDEADEVQVRIPTSGRASVSGHVRDADGRPVVGARVLVHVRESASTGFCPFQYGMARTGRDGSYEIPDLLEEPLQLVSVEAPGYVAWSRTPCRTPLLAGRPLDIDVTLVRVGRLEVHVRDEEGKPIAGAEVTSPPWSDSWSLQERRGPVSDAKGLIVLEDAPPGAGELLVSAPGFYQPSVKSPCSGRIVLGVSYPALTPGESRCIDVVLRRGPTLVGCVVDSRGEPVAQSALTLCVHRSDMSRGGGFTMRRVETDPEGKFAFTGLPPASGLSLNVHDERFPSASTEIDPASLDEELPVRIVVPDGATVAGRMVDSADLPVPGVLVMCEHAPSFVCTDAEGRFLFERVLPGRRRVYAGPHAQSAAGVYVDLQPGQVVDDVVLRHDGAHVIEGIVLDDDAPTLAGIAVQVMRQPGNSPSTTAFCDRDGRFRVERVPEGRYRIISESAFVDVEVGETEVVVVRLVRECSPSFVLEGKVVDPEGNPVADAAVRVAEPADGPHTQRAGTVVLGGRFRVRVPGKMRPVSAHVTGAKDPAGRPLNVLPARADLDPALGEFPVIRLAPAARLRGRILDEDGRPVAWLSVRISRHYGERSSPHLGVGRRVRSLHGITAEDGSFEFSGLEQAPYRMDFMPGRNHAPPENLVVHPGGEPVVLRLVRYRSLTVRVLGPDEEPVAGCRVSFWPTPFEEVPNPPDRMHGVSLQRSGSTDADGMHRETHLSPEACLTVRVTPPEGPGPAADLYPDVREGVTPSDETLTFVLKVGRKISGRVLDSGGRPVVGARVHLRGPQKERDPRTRRRPLRPLVPLDRHCVTDADGHYVFNRLPAGFELALFVKGPQDADPPYFDDHREAIPTGAEDVTFVLERAVAIEGEVPGVDAGALRGLHIQASPLVHGAPGARFVFNGSTTSFRLSPLRSGPYELRLRGGQDLQYEGLLPVVAPTAGLVLEISRMYTLAGAVFGAGGEEFTVEFHTAEGRRAQSRADRYGLFRIGRFHDIVGALLVYRKGDARVALLPEVRTSHGEPLIVKLEPGRPISGRIVGLPGKFLDGKVVAEQGFARFVGEVSQNGEFTTPVLPPGRYKLSFECRHPQDGSVPTPEFVEAGTTDLVLEWAGPR